MKLSARTVKALLDLFQEGESRHAPGQGQIIPVEIFDEAKQLFQKEYDERTRGFAPK